MSSNQIKEYFMFYQKNINMFFGEFLSWHYNIWGHLKAQIKDNFMLLIESSNKFSSIFKDLGVITRKLFLKNITNVITIKNRIL